MKAILILFFFFFNLSLFGQVNDGDAFFTSHYDKNYVDQHKIKQITTQFYIDGDRSFDHIFNFNRLGFLLTQRILNNNGEIVNEYLFKNNKEGDQIERITIDHGFDKIDTVTFTKIYEAGQLVQESSSQIPFVTKHVYNTDGKRTQSITFLGVDTAISEKRIFFYTYDTSGKLKSIQETYVSSNNSTRVNIGHTEYIYDDANNITNILPEGKANYSFSYFDNGLLKSKTVKMPEEFSGLLLVEKYSYISW